MNHESISSKIEEIAEDMASVVDYSFEYHNKIKARIRDAFESQRPNMYLRRKIPTVERFEHLVIKKLLQKSNF